MDVKGQRLNERQQAVWELLELCGEVKIGELKQRFDVTEMTIRRDLEKLEQLGGVRRTFGGAILTGREDTLRERNSKLLEEKLRIGRLAAGLIGDGQSVFIDGGSTTLQIAKHIPPGKAVTVVTNGLNIAMELLERKIPTIVTGGDVLEHTVSLTGPIAVETLGRMAFNQVFLGASGLTAGHGLSNTNGYETEIKRAAIRAGTTINVVLDRSKFGVKALYSYAELGHIHRIITDRLPEDEELVTACRDAGIEWCVANWDGGDAHVPR